MVFISIIHVFALLKDHLDSFCLKVKYLVIYNDENQIIINKKVHKIQFIFISICTQTVR